MSRDCKEAGSLLQLEGPLAERHCCCLPSESQKGTKSPIVSTHQWQILSPAWHQSLPDGQTHCWHTHCCRVLSSYTGVCAVNGNTAFKQRTDNTHVGTPHPAHRQHTDSTQTTYRQHTDSTQTTYKQHTAQHQSSPRHLGAIHSNVPRLPLAASQALQPLQRRCRRPSPSPSASRSMRTAAATGLTALGNAPAQPPVSVHSP